MLRLVLCAFLLSACAEATPPRALGELIVEDSTYLDPETLIPYTGPVFRMFEDDSEEAQLEGALVDGTWDGGFVVYHENGRIRYSGSFANGDRCGPWIENQEPESPGDIFQELEQAVESMGVYPECPGS